jgi:hypothetical protein
MKGAVERWSDGVMEYLSHEISERGRQLRSQPGLLPVTPTPYHSNTPLLHFCALSAVRPCSIAGADEKERKGKI